MSAPTVPDEDFFSLIMRFQSSGRLDDQRSNLPDDIVRAAAVPLLNAANHPAPTPIVCQGNNSIDNDNNNNSHDNESGGSASQDVAAGVGGDATGSNNDSSKDNLMSRLVKGKK